MTRHAARLLAFAAAVGCAGAVAAQAPFRGSVDLVSLNVTVTEAGHYVTNLEEADFEVFEDGIKQQTTVLFEGAAADCAGDPARHERQHGQQARDRPGGGRRLRASGCSPAI